MELHVREKSMPFNSLQMHRFLPERAVMPLAINNITASYRIRNIRIKEKVEVVIQKHHTRCLKDPLHW